jgi:hypothetical protein
MTMRVCSAVGCPTLIPQGESRCATHRSERERARGTRQQRGYDRDHDALRKQWEPRVSTGRVHCWRCGELIKATADWHLGHDDDDRRIHRGPEHVLCNLSEAGRRSHA